MKKVHIVLIFVVILMLIFILDFNNPVITVDTNPTDSFPTILLDAGHGGVDGGASSKDGKIVEKHLNLEIAMKLKPILQLFGYNVVTTRETDVSIHDDSANSIRQKKVSDIRNRLSLLENSDAQLLLSIHQNTYSESIYSGTQVFYGRKNPLSKQFAQSIQQSVHNLLQPENNRKIKISTKDIFLLNNAEKPSVMVECGFLSNIRECDFLTKESYQKKLSFCILNGLLLSEINSYNEGITSIDP